MPTEPASLTRKRAALTARAACLKAMRQFFYGQEFLEFETPVRVRAPALETHIDAEPSGHAFLRTSPELHMKRLLGAGYERIYQIGPCFRSGEAGDRHHPEYTMLEWYRTRADYRDMLRDTQQLIRHTANALGKGPAFSWQGRPIDLDADWIILTVRDAYRQWAGWDPVAAYDPDRFDVDMANIIEGEIQALSAPVILIDYPAEAAALARRKPDTPEVAERWELYIAGIELANAYSELTDRAEQTERFAQCAKQRAQAGRTVYPIDTRFLEALDTLPPCGGIALGVDRLVMLFTDAPTIADVCAFDPREETAR